MEYIFYILIAIIISIIISQIRIFTQSTTQSTKNILEGSVGWVLVIYGLLLGFSISNFYNRYINIRETFITEVTNLQLIYRYFAKLPNSKNVICSIEAYSKSVLKNLLPNLAKQKYCPLSNELYIKMNDQIITYIDENPNSTFNNNILSRMSTNERIKKLTDEIEAGWHYIHILSFLLIFICIPLTLNIMPNKTLQMIVDMCILIILLTGIYLCVLLNNPFTKSPISLNLSMYQDLVDEIDLAFLKND